jgi:hypothetical protein
MKTRSLESLSPISTSVLERSLAPPVAERHHSTCARRLLRWVNPVFLLLSFLPCAQAVWPVPGNLIINGSFENGYLGWDGTLGLYNTPNPLSGTTVGVNTDIWSSSVGRCMYQTLATTPGMTYRIGFGLRLPELFEIAPGIWVPVAGDSSGASTVINLLWNSSDLRDIPVTDHNHWTLYTLDVVADTTSSTLTFYNGPGSRAWPFVDNVSVVAVPEPNAAALGALGFSMLLLHRSSPARYQRKR